MSLEPRVDQGVPELTARLVRAAFPKGTLAVRIREALGPLFEDEAPSRAVRLVDTERWQVDDGTAHMELTDSEATFAAVQEVGFLRLLDEDQFAPSRVTWLNVATVEPDARTTSTGLRAAGQRRSCGAASSGQTPTARRFRRCHTEGWATPATAATSPSPACSTAPRSNT